MRTPISEVLLMLAPILVRVTCEIPENKEELEVILQDKLNAQFGDTVQTVETLESVHNALKDVAKEFL